MRRSQLFFCSSPLRGPLRWSRFSEIFCVYDVEYPGASHISLRAPARQDPLDSNKKAPGLRPRALTPPLLWEGSLSCLISLHAARCLSGSGCWQWAAGPAACRHGRRRRGNDRKGHHLEAGTRTAHAGPPQVQGRRHQDDRRVCNRCGRRCGSRLPPCAHWKQGPFACSGRWPQCTVSEGDGEYACRCLRTVGP